MRVGGEWGELWQLGRTHGELIALAVAQRADGELLVLVVHLQARAIARDRLGPKRHLRRPPPVFWIMPPPKPYWKLLSP